MYAFSIAAAMMKAKLDVKVGATNCMLHFAALHLPIRHGRGRASWSSAALFYTLRRRCCRRSRPSACS